MLAIDRLMPTKASERLLSMHFAYRTLVADGDFVTPTNVKAVEYLLKRNENPMCEAGYILAVQAKIAELAALQGEIDLQAWISSYLMILPLDPFEALTYDRILVKVFRGELTTH